MENGDRANLAGNTPWLCLPQPSTIHLLSSGAFPAQIHATLLVGEERRTGIREGGIHHAPKLMKSRMM